MEHFLLLWFAFMQHQPESSVESKWLSYYQLTSQFSKPWDTTVYAVERFQNEGFSPQLAIDLGCGVGKDSAYLLQNGWKVIAVDLEEAAREFLFQKIPSESDLVFVLSSFEQFLFPHQVQLINASFSLPFCSPPAFSNLMHRITAAISRGGRFAGHFFGPHDSWAQTDRNLVFLTREQLLIYFEGFIVEYYLEEEKDGASGSGPKHWHIHHIVAKKL